MAEELIGNVYFSCGQQVEDIGDKVCGICGKDTSDVWYATGVIGTNRPYPWKIYYFCSPKCLIAFGKKLRHDEYAIEMHNQAVKRSARKIRQAFREARTEDASILWLKN